MKSHVRSFGLHQRCICLERLSVLFSHSWAKTWQVCDMFQCGRTCCESQHHAANAAHVDCAERHVLFGVAIVLYCLGRCCVLQYCDRLVFSCLCNCVLSKTCHDHSNPYHPTGSLASERAPPDMCEDGHIATWLLQRISINKVAPFDAVLAKVTNSFIQPGVSRPASTASDSDA